MGFILFVFIALALLVAVSGVYCFIVACVRRKETDWLDEAALKKTSYAKYHNAIVASDRWLKEHEAHDVYVDSHDGLRLHGIWIPAENPKGTMLLAHGYRSTKLLDFGIAFAFYHALGMNLLVPDQRSHGQSEGRYITFGVKECEDMLTWIRYHNQHLGGGQMILSGLSMGASTVMYLADRALPWNVKGIIADCGFSSPCDIISTVFRKVTHLPAAPSIWVADLCAKLFAGFSLREKSSLDCLRNNTVPVLLIHGTKDNFVPCEMTKRAYEACDGMKKLLLVEGAGHGVSFLVDQDLYTQTVYDFLKENLEGFGIELRNDQEL